MTAAAPWAGRMGHAVVAHDGKVWVLGGLIAYLYYMNDVWSSPDGVNWTEVSPMMKAPWGPRHDLAAASFAGKLWVIGGYSGRNEGTHEADIWSSPDGVAWTQVTTPPEWPGRMGHTALVHQNMLWVLGGASLRDVWHSADGISWTPATLDAPWGGDCVAAESYEGKIWALTTDYRTNAMWNSENGVEWEPVIEALPFPRRWWSPTLVVYHNKLVVSGGGNGLFNDVWHCEDGVQWLELQSRPIWKPRAQHGALVFNDGYWIMGGYDGNSYLSDVWRYAGAMGCEANANGVNDPPRVSLLADPPSGPAPLEVVFMATGSDPDCDPLTYLWDFGDGSPASTQPSVLHIFQSAGTYTVTVAVSDGELAATTTARVTVGPLPHVQDDIGANGGSLDLGLGHLQIDAGVLPAGVDFVLTEYPSMGSLAQLRIGIPGAVPIGPAYDLVTPARTSAPMALTIVYDPADIPAGYSASNLGFLVRMVGVPDDPKGAAQFASVAADYAILPAVVDPAGHTATLDMYCSNRVQLVALPDPIEVVSAEPKAAPSPFEIVFDTSPTVLSRKDYGDIATDVLSQTFNTLVLGRGFPGPLGKMKIVVKSMNCNGFVGKDPQIISLSHELTAHNLHCTLPHEFMHCIQIVCSNPVSDSAYIEEDAWVYEGQAEWAADEVFDNYSGQYFMVTGERFNDPLNHRPRDRWTLNEYKTVAFWKWVEAVSPGTILATYLNQQSLTHTPLWVNQTLVKWQDSFFAAYPNCDFLQFVADSMFWKDYDTNEINDKDLWTADCLGSPGSVPKTFGYEDNFIWVERDSAGDGDTNKALVEFNPKDCLSADIRVVWTRPQTAPEDRLTGKLHVEWPKTAEPLDAMVIAARNGSALEYVEVRDLSQTHEVTKVRFSSDADYRAIIIIVDPRWKDPAGSFLSPNPVAKVWVEDPCGQLPGNIIDVATTDELVAAVKSTPPGNTIRLANGFYYPPLADYVIPDWDTTYPARVFLGLNGLALVGSGNTTIVLSGAAGYTGIATGGNSAIRNLTISSRATHAIEAFNDLTVCNVTISVRKNWPYNGEGILFVPQQPGAYSLTVKDCTIQNIDISNDYCYGIYPTCLDSSYSISMTVEGTAISGFKTGIEWWGGGPEDGLILATVSDCDLFSANTDGNAVEYVFDYCDGVCHYNPVEHCP